MKIVWVRISTTRRLFYFWVSLIWIGISISSTPLAAQSWITEKIGVREGLASPDVWSLHQDERLQLWIGTNAGISVYDGQRFRNYSHSAEGYRLGRVKAIGEDDRGRLWIGADQGLFYWQAGTFHLALADLHINALAFTPDGRLWLGCMQGLYWLTPKPEKMQLDSDLHYLHRQDSIFGNDLRITDLAVLPQGDLLIATYFYVCRYDASGLRQIWGSPTQKPDVQQLAVANDSTFYWACDETSFYRYSAGNISTVDNMLQHATDVVANEQGLWMLTYDGLFVQQDHQTLSIPLQASDTEWLRCLYIDREKNIWIGSFEGLIKLKSSVFTVYPTYPQEVYSIGEHPAGGLLLGANRGQLWHCRDTSCRSFLKGVVSQAEIFAQHVLEKDIWFGTGYQGIARLRGAHIDTYDTQNGLSDNSRFFFFRDRAGQFWTGGDGGIDRVDQPNSEAVTFISYAYQTGSDDYVSFYAAAESPAGVLWLGSSHGLFRLVADRIQPATLKGFPARSIFITDVVQPSEKDVWLSTMGDGLLHCRFLPDGQMEFVAQYSQGQQMPTNSFLDLLMDRDGILWAGTYRGVARIDLEAAEAVKLRFYDRGDGFSLNSFTNMKLYQATDGRIWGGTSAGVFSFNPTDLYPNPIAPRLLVTDIQLEDGKRPLHDYALANSSYTGLPQSLVLPYDVNHIRIGFSGIGLRKPDALQFRYRLEGTTEDWVYTQNERWVNYHRLPEGQYRFRVEAANEDGIWSQQAAFLDLRIRPAFWDTWWFRTLMVFGIAGMSFLFISRRQRKLQAEAERERERLELQKKIAESKLTALQAQMNPHFVFNSLNSINWYIVKNRPQEASAYLAKFSKLVRLILDNSNKLTFTLAKELDTLQLYLDLEAMRFGDRFTYQIQTDADLDPEEIMVPPLILQPYVENAIWHGLMHKDGKGELLIQIFPDGDDLKCIIQDNGIGRKAAAELQRKQPKQHQSKGLQLTADRIRLLHTDVWESELIRIIDLVNEHERAIGTRVEISLPLE